MCGIKIKVTSRRALVRVVSYCPPAALTKKESERLQKEATRGLSLCRLHTPVRRLGRTYLRP